MTEVNAVNAQPRELDSISGTELEAIRENLADSHIKPLRMGNQSAHSPESRQNNPITKPPPVASYHAVHHRQILGSLWYRRSRAPFRGCRV